MNKQKFYFKIFLILILSFLITKLAINEVFLANTPRIRHDLPKYLAGRISSLFKYKDTKTIENIEKTAFTQLSKGIYAKSLPKGGSYLLIKENEVEWIEYTFDIKGKQIKIKVPKGENPPPKEFVEKIYE